MTRERREEAILVALVLSLAIHVGLMAYFRPRVMTRVARGLARIVRHEPMSVGRVEGAPEPVRIVDLDDVAAKKDAPDAEDAIVMPTLEAVKSVTDEKPVPAPANPELAPHPALERPAEFSAEALKLDDDVSAKIPTVPFETPKAVSAEAPDVRAGLPVAKTPEFAAPSIASVVSAADLPRGAALVGSGERRTAVFVPANEVYAEVDEKIVTKEKEAVRDLLAAEETLSLEKFVGVTMTTCDLGGWTYFNVMLNPRHELPVVPKDVVVLLDASGSIGNDRLASCRNAARRILRSCTNTGDRFNLVAFRDRYQYLSKTWTECDQDGFDRADKWLAKLAAHGRTDVFASITSVLTLPRDPARPLVAMVVTDGEANMGVKETTEILSKFTALNDGLVSVYMYGVKSSANRELIKVLTRGNRGESHVHTGMRWSAGEGVDGLTERFRDPVLSDIRVIFTATSRADAYPRRLKNLYRGDTLEIVGRVPQGVKSVSFSVMGLNGARAYEGLFTRNFAEAAADPSLPGVWAAEETLDRKLR